MLESSGGAAESNLASVDRTSTIRTTVTVDRQDGRSSVSLSPKSPTLSSQSSAISHPPPTSHLGTSMNSRNPGVRIFQTEKAISSTNYPTSTDTRGLIPVFEYRIGNSTNKILIDRETGYVLISGMWKALGRIKADVIKLIESQPKIAPVVRKIRGGVLDIQGTWLPYNIAKELARRVAWPIRHELIPIFGPLFPSTCLAPDAPGFGDLVLSEPQAAKTASNPELREKARQAAHAAQNNSRVSTITQASQAKTSYRTSLEADDESELAPPLTGNARSQPPPLGPLFTTSPLPNSREERRPQQDPRVGPARPSWKGYKAPLRRPQLSPANSLPSRLSPYPAVRHPPTTHLQYVYRSSSRHSDPRHPSFPSASPTFPASHPQQYPRHPNPYPLNAAQQARRSNRYPPGTFLKPRPPFSSYTPSFPLPVASLDSTLTVPSPRSNLEELLRIPPTGTP